MADDRQASGVSAPAEQDTTRRGWLAVVAVAVGVGLAMGLLVFSVVAMPVYALAQADRNGLDRPLLRTLLVRVAVPAGLVAMVLAGGLIGHWYRKGGRLPTDRSEW